MVVGVVGADNLGCAELGCIRLNWGVLCSAGRARFRCLQLPACVAGRTVAGFGVTWVTEV